MRAKRAVVPLIAAWLSLLGAAGGIIAVDHHVRASLAPKSVPSPTPKATTPDWHTVTVTVTGSPDANSSTIAPSSPVTTGTAIVVDPPLPTSPIWGKR